MAYKTTLVDEIDQLVSRPLKAAYLLSGNDDYLEQYAIGRLCTAFEQQHKTKVERFQAYGELDEDEPFFDHLTTTGMFTTTRIIIYHNIAKMEARYRKRLLAYLKNPSDHTLLILTAPAEGKTKFIDELTKSGLLYTLKTWTPFPEQYPVVFRQLIKDSGYTLTADALHLLINLTNDNLAHTMSEWEKLLLFIGDRKQVTVRDVQQVVSGSKDYDIHDFLAAVAAKNAPEAVKIGLHLLQGDLSWPFLIMQLYDLFVSVWARESIDLDKVFFKKRKILESAITHYQHANLGAIFRTLRRTDLAAKTTNQRTELMIPLIYELIG